MFLATIIFFIHRAQSLVESYLTHYAFVILWKFSFLINIFSKLKAQFFPSVRKTEPMDTPWYCICSLTTAIPKEAAQASLSLVDPDDTEDTRLKIHFSEYFAFSYDQYINIDSAPDTTHIYCYMENEATNEKRYISRRESNRSLKKPLVLDELLNASSRAVDKNHRIVFADYTHPELDDPISLHNISDFCAVGNDLFTPEFIYRYLVYSEDSAASDAAAAFDDKYEIVAMDNMTNVYYVRYGEYLHYEAADKIVVKKV